MVKPSENPTNQAEFFAKLAPESQAFLMQPDLHPIVTGMRDGRTIVEAEIEMLLMLDSERQSFDLRNCTLKYCSEDEHIKLWNF